MYNATVLSKSNGAIGLKFSVQNWLWWRHLIFADKEVIFLKEIIVLYKSNKMTFSTNIVTVKWDKCYECSTFTFLQAMSQQKISPTQYILKEVQSLGNIHSLSLSASLHVDGRSSGIRCDDLNNRHSSFPSRLLLKMPTFNAISILRYFLQKKVDL